MFSMCEGTNIPRFLLLLPHIFEILHINAVILSNVNLQVDARGISLGCRVEGAEVKELAQGLCKRCCEMLRSAQHDIKH